MFRRRDFRDALCGGGLESDCQCRFVPVGSHRDDRPPPVRYECLSHERAGP
jgi:hypothetical protein